MDGFSQFGGLFVPFNVAHEAARRDTAETLRWNATIRSPDTELLPEREVLLARQRDMLRNNGIASGAMQTKVDDIVGTGLRLLPRPNWRALGQSAEWAHEWQKIVKSEWSQFAYDVDRTCDYRRMHTIDGLIYQAARSYLFNDEITATLEWDARAPRWSTSVNLFHPDLVSTPDTMAETYSLRQGVQKGPRGEAIGYYIRQAHRSEEATPGAPLSSWKYVPVYAQANGQTWGRRNIVHIFDQQQPDQTRGKPSFAAALLELQSLKKFHRKALEQQIIQAMYAAVITSNASPDVVGTAMGRGDGSSPLEQYTAAQQGYAKGTGGINLDGVRVPHLMMGEKLEFMTPGNVAPNLDAFERWTLHHLAAALNMSYEALSRDYTQTSYSSARASGLREWRFITGRRAHIIDPFATAIYVAWLEEAIDRGRVPVPSGAPSFYEAKTAWCGCKWVGAARGAIDEAKDTDALLKRRQLGSLTYEELCALNGDDADEILDRLALEEKQFQALKARPFMPGQSPNGGNPAPAEDAGATPTPSRVPA